ncbi:MAG: hypothetical protein J6P03_05565 [Opitutales bacterium]|nr:hypothetical protein [Opitutales bacterium]
MTDAAKSAIEDCCCGDPCASGCGYIDLAGPWGVWRLNRRGDLDPDNPNFYDYIGDDGQAGIGAPGAGFAAWDVGRLHCSFEVSCDGDKTVIECVACYDLDSYDIVPCPGLSLAGGCYKPCCACCVSGEDFPATIQATVVVSVPWVAQGTISYAYNRDFAAAGSVHYSASVPGFYACEGGATPARTSFAFGPLVNLTVTNPPADYYYLSPQGTVGLARSCDEGCADLVPGLPRGNSWSGDFAFGYVDRDYVYHPLSPITMVLTW